MKKFLVLIPVFLIGIVSVFSFKEEEKKEELTIKNNTISYTIDGESVSEVPKKEEGYIVNKIECKNNSNLVWDNTNWQVELHNLTSTDSCKIDFTSDTTKEGYRVTIVDTSNLIESTSKATINGGNISFNVKSGNITNVTGCTGVIENNTLKINNVTSNETCTVTISGDTGSFVAGTIGYKILEDNPTRLTRTDFSTVLTTSNTNTLYSVSGNFTEGGETVYYFAGNAQNNWVKFGKDSSNNDLYWRIIRTNEDGGVRLLYVGTATDTETGYIGSAQAYNSTYNNTMYVGYMYGTTGSLANNRNNTTSAPIKTTIDNWYNTGLNTKTDGTYKYDAYISKTAIYCNDRATSSYASSGTMYYASYDRLDINKQPSYKCGVTYTGSLYESTQASADKFSVNTASGGNGKLTYPVALMTADEVAYAGGVYATNAATWYYYNSASGSVTGTNYWWTMSPHYFTGGNGWALVFIVHGSKNPGRLVGYYVYNASYVARPALSLKSCVTYKSGNGSSSTPYEVEISSACASLEN